MLSIHNWLISWNQFLKMWKVFVRFKILNDYFINYLLLDVVENVSSIYDELSQGLDGTRHKIHLVNINPIEDKDIDKTCSLMKQATSICSNIQIEKMNEIAEAASVLSRLDDISNNQLKIMDE